MIKNIEIVRPSSSQFFEVGENIIRGEKETDIKVEKIKTYFQTSKIYLSNGEVFIFKGDVLI